MAKAGEIATKIATSYFEALGRQDLDAATAVWKPGGVDRLVGDQELSAPDGIRGYFGALFAARTDVYASGVMLFELLTGVQPHKGESPLEIAYKHVDEIVPAPSSITPGLAPALDALVALATSRDPELRPADASQFLHAITAVRRGLPIAGALDACCAVASSRARTAILSRNCANNCGGGSTTSSPLVPSTALHRLAAEHETDTRSAFILASTVPCVVEPGE